MNDLRMLRWLVALAIPFLLAMHDGGCAADSGSNEVPPDTIDGCTLVFHKTEDLNSEGARWKRDLVYTFNDSDHKVHAEGSGGGGFVSKSYSYSGRKPYVITIDWGNSATEKIELTSHTDFEYTGDDGTGGPDVRVKGTYEPQGTCGAFKG